MTNTALRHPGTATSEQDETLNLDALPEATQRARSLALDDEPDAARQLLADAHAGIDPNTDTRTAIDAELARHDPAHDRKHAPSMTEAPPRRVLRLHLRTAHGGTAYGAVPIFVQAFNRTPLARWLYPAVGERGNALRMAFACLIDDASVNGSVVLAYQGGTPVGAVLWRTCPARDETDPAVSGFTPGNPGNARLTMLTDRLAHRHPPEPHECLQALAVLPGRESQGIAGALLASTTTRPRMSRFVLTPGPVRGLLHQLRYQPCGDQIVLPNDGPPLQPFWFTALPPQPKETKR